MPSLFEGGANSGAALNRVNTVLLLMLRDYYIKINLFKYPSVMNQPLNHLVDKSVNQSIKNLWLTVLPMQITNGPVTTSDFI